MGRVRNRANVNIRKKYKAISPEQFKQRVIALAQKASKGVVSFDELSDLQILAPKCNLTKEDMAEFQSLISRIKQFGKLRFSGAKFNKGSSVHTVPNRIG